MTDKKPDCVKGLTDEQKGLFDSITQELRRETAIAYINNGFKNKTQSYLNACSNMGRKPSKNPETSASEILGYPNVVEFINSVRLESAREAQVDATFILMAAKDIYDRCTQKVAPALSKGGDKIFDEDGNPIYAFNSKDALSALKLMGDHIDVQAFKKVVENKITIEDMTDDELDRKLRALGQISEG